MRRAAPPAPASARPPFDVAPRPPRASTTAAVIGGYRLVRRLGGDDEVVTWLARGGEETVVLRVFRETASDARIDAEIGARERLSGPHVPALLDLATGPGGRPVAVLAVVVGPVLRDVIVGWGRPLRAGHVTTILAPLAALLDAAHEVGATLGRLDTAGIRLDPSGAPVVMSFALAGAAAPLPARFRAHEEAVVDDRRALDALAAELAELVDRHERDSVLAAVASAVGDPAALELALFDCAAPLPLAPLRDADADPEPVGPAARAESDAVTQPDALTSRGRTSAVGSPVRGTGASVDGREGTPAGGRSTRAGVVGQVGHRLGLPAGLLDPVEGIVQEVRERGRRIRGRLGGMRRSAQRPRRGVVIAGAAGVLALAAAIGLASLEAEAGTESSPAPPVPSSSPSEGAGGAEDGPVTPPPDAAAARPAEGAGAADLPESAGDPSAEQWAPLVGALIDRWLDCAEAPSSECASGAAHTGSAAEEALLATGATAGAAPGSGPSGSRGVLERWAASARELVVVDRQGAAAIIDLVEAGTTTASLLVLRSEAGWRLRAVMPIEVMPTG